MATNFSKYTSKKLNKMLETGNLSEEDKNAIIDELAARETAEAAEAPTAKMGQAEGQVYEDPDIDDATRQAWAEAEKTGGKVEKKKLNEEELMKLAEEVRVNVGHKCLVVVPSVSINPVDGVIKAVVINKAAAQVFYTVVLESGRQLPRLGILQLFRFQMRLLSSLLQSGIQSPVSSGLRKNGLRLPTAQLSLLAAR